MWNGAGFCIKKTPAFYVSCNCISDRKECSLWCIFTFFYVCVQLSQQILELFQACRQQASDLDRKELCRTELQREIQLIFPRMFWIWLLNISLHLLHVCDSSFLSNCNTSHDVIFLLLFYYREQTFFGWVLTEWIWHSY